MFRKMTTVQVLNQLSKQIRHTPVIERLNHINTGTRFSSEILAKQTHQTKNFYSVLSNNPSRMLMRANSIFENHSNNNFKNKKRDYNTIRGFAEDNQEVEKFLIFGSSLSLAITYCVLRLREKRKIEKLQKQSNEALSTAAEELGISSEEQDAVIYTLGVHGLHYNNKTPTPENARQWLVAAVKSLKDKCSDSLFLEMDDKQKEILSDKAAHVWKKANSHEINLGFYKQTIEAVCQLVETKNNEYLENQSRLLPRQRRG